MKKGRKEGRGSGREEGGYIEILTASRFCLIYYSPPDSAVLTAFALYVMAIN
jgi:hypothetical protein